VLLERPASVVLEEPIKKILIDTQHLWDRDGDRPWVRESFRRMIECRTPALGWQIYASETEVKRVYHTCKVKSCPSCGYRATLQWQREQWTQLPDVPYSGLLFTMPDVFWRMFQQNWDLLHDLPTLIAVDERQVPSMPADPGSAAHFRKASEIQPAPSHAGFCWWPL